jgi:hypothetical protein
VCFLDLWGGSARVDLPWLLRSSNQRLWCNSCCVQITWQNSSRFDLLGLHYCPSACTAAVNPSLLLGAQHDEHGQLPMSAFSCKSSDVALNFGWPWEPPLQETLILCVYVFPQQTCHAW